jgi:hypothetical protein
VRAARTTEIASFFCGVAIAVVWPQDQSKSARKQLNQKLINSKISRKKKCDERQATSRVSGLTQPIKGLPAG